LFNDGLPYVILPTTVYLILVCLQCRFLLMSVCRMDGLPTISVRNMPWRVRSNICCSGWIWSGQLSSVRVWKICPKNPKKFHRVRSKSTRVKASYLLRIKSMLGSGQVMTHLYLGPWTSLLGRPMVEILTDIVQLRETK